MSTELICPIPIEDYPHVLLAHGGGGRLMRQLLERLIVPTLCEPSGAGIHDAAVLPSPADRVAMTTDAFVVTPLFFPGGDIGSLAVHGTVNDLAMAGAMPVALSVSLILEEGLPMDTLWRVLQSLRAAADSAGVRIVTGDTKVVERGTGDGIFINTTGLGRVTEGLRIHPDQIQAGDVLIVSGDVGRHGIAIMAEREDLRFETTVTSDAASLHGLVGTLLDADVPVHCLRDLTRGGLAAALNELAQQSRFDLQIDEADVPVRSDVAAACEILGLDPFHVACEGRMVIVVPASHVDQTLVALRNEPLGAGATLVGRVTGPGGRVHLRSRIGGSRILDLPSGEQLPRIC
ncbi:MAG: hydrogenase expression/formation protein HypE [Pseudomonadota bacterium]|nr:hydrogenase expression/formation protein HypE [Pseudomonadota bacterium]